MVVSCSKWNKRAVVKSNQHIRLYRSGFGVVLVGLICCLFQSTAISQVNFGDPEDYEVQNSEIS